MCSSDLSLASGPRIYGTMLGLGASIADIDDWPKRIAAVTPADVLAAARLVWREDAQVTSMLLPEGGR